MPDGVIEGRMAELGLTLPEAPKPVAAYVPSVRSGREVFVSGQIPFKNGELMAQGSVPGEVSETLAAACALQCVLNGLAVVRDELGTLDAVERVVRLGVFVACGAGYGGQPAVANGASEILARIFGDAGRHARAAVGCAALPLNAPVEVEMLVTAKG